MTSVNIASKQESNSNFPRSKVTSISPVMMKDSRHQTILTSIESNHPEMLLQPETEKSSRASLIFLSNPFANEFASEFNSTSKAFLRKKIPREHLRMVHDSEKLKESAQDSVQHHSFRRELNNSPLSFASTTTSKNPKSSFDLPVSETQIDQLATISSSIGISGSSSKRNFINKREISASRRNVKDPNSALHPLSRENLAAFQAIHQSEKTIPPLLKKDRPALLPETPPLLFSSPSIEAIQPHLNPHFLSPPHLQSIPEFPFTNMMPLPYYAFPYVDYRAVQPDSSFAKDGNHPAIPTFPVFAAVPPTGVLAQTDPSATVPMPLLASPTGSIPGINAPESPQFGPGPPIITGERLKGPRGCNLFVFHLPNEITNWDLYLLFRRYGTILSVHIMVNKATGLSKGYGFVSFAFPNDAKNAMQGMDGFRLGKKRLKVQLKRLQDDSIDEFYWDGANEDQVPTQEPGSGRTSSSNTSHASPNKASLPENYKRSTSPIPSQIKLRDATKKLGEINLGDGNGKTSSYRGKTSREALAKESKD